MPSFLNIHPFSLNKELYFLINSKWWEILEFPQLVFWGKTYDGLFYFLSFVSYIKYFLLWKELLPKGNIKVALRTKIDQFAPAHLQEVIKKAQSNSMQYKGQIHQQMVRMLFGSFQIYGVSHSSYFKEHQN